MPAGITRPLKRCQGILKIAQFLTMVESASSSARLMGSSLGLRRFKAELLPIDLSLEVL